MYWEVYSEMGRACRRMVWEGSGNCRHCLGRKRKDTGLAGEEAGLYCHLSRGLHVPTKSSKAGMALQVVPNCGT